MKTIEKTEDIQAVMNEVFRLANISLKNNKPLYVYLTDKKQEEKATSKQRGSLHVFCSDYAKALNDAGYYRPKALFKTREIVEVDWTMITFKEDIYKPLLFALTKKTSTEEQSTVNPSEVAAHINRHFSQNYGISVPWPTNKPTN